MDDTFSGYLAKVDMNARTIVLSKASDKNWTAPFKFQRADTDHMTLTGSMDGHRIDLRLTRFDRSKLLLVSRGFYWVQEFPFNR